MKAGISSPSLSSLRNCGRWFWAWCFRREVPNFQRRNKVPPDGAPWLGRGDDAPGDCAAGDQEVRKFPDIPEAETHPRGIVVRPPADTRPAFALVDLRGPGAAAGLVAADDVGRAKSQVQQLLRIVGICRSGCH